MISGISTTAVTPQLSNEIRASRQFFIEVLFSKDSGGTFQNKVDVDLSSILRENSLNHGGIQRFSISISDYYVQHEDGWDPANRAGLFILAPELTPATRYMSGLFSDVGTSLSGSALSTVGKIPGGSVKFSVGKLNLNSLTDTNLYHPNSGIADNPAGQPTQELKLVLLRFSLSVSYLTT